MIKEVIIIKFAAPLCIFLTGTTRSGICQLERSCCSSEAERSFKDYVVKHYRDKVIGQLSGGLMGCHNHSITGELSCFPDSV